MFTVTCSIELQGAEVLASHLSTRHILRVCVIVREWP
jgi:hypothetical protein